MSQHTEFTRDRCIQCSAPALCASLGMEGLRLTPGTCGMWRTIEELEPGHPLFRHALNLLKEWAEGIEHHGAHQASARKLLAKVRPFGDLDELESAWLNGVDEKPLGALHLAWTSRARLEKAGLKTVRDLRTRTRQELRDLPGVGAATLRDIRHAFRESHIPTVESAWACPTCPAPSSFKTTPKASNMARTGT